MRITANVDAGDPTTKLCGTQKAGTRTYSWEMTGNIDIDDDLGDTGIFALSQAEYGTEQEFEFTPNTGAVTKATGILIIDPLDFGADEFGADMTSDLTWALVGEPVYTYAVAGGGAEAVGTADDEPAPAPTKRTRATATASP
jgi:hypothetical protein